MWASKQPLAARQMLRWKLQEKQGKTIKKSARQLPVDFYNKARGRQTRLAPKGIGQLKSSHGTNNPKSFAHPLGHPPAGDSKLRRLTLHRPQNLNLNP
jgi:hypothetical protein